MAEAALKKETWDISPLSRAAYTLIAMTAAFMAILDTTIVDVIVPKLIGPMATDMYGIQWVITSYLCASAIGILLVDKLADHFGTKHVHIAGVGLFTIFSLGTALSGDLSIMILCRSLQGLGESLLLVTAQTMVFGFFSPKQKGIAMGVFGMGVSFAPALGPTVGGYLTEYFDWRMCFMINVPIGIIAVVAGLILLPNTGERKALHINLRSFSALTIGTVALLIMLSQGQQYGWFNSSYIGMLAFTALFGFLFYFLSEMYSKQMLMDLPLFKIPDFTLGILVFFFVLGLSMYQFFYLLPVYYEQLKMQTTLQAGHAVLAFAIFIGLFSPIAGKLSDTFGSRYVLLFSSVIYLIGSYVLLPSLNYYTPVEEGMLRSIPLGIAMGCLFAPATLLIMKNSPPGKENMAVAMMDYFRYVGGSIGTALATNDLYDEQYREFSYMEQAQNPGVVLRFIEQMQEAAGISEELAMASFAQYETLMSVSYAYHDIFTNASYWAMLGLFFVICMFLVPKKYRKDSSQ